MPDAYGSGILTTKRYWDNDLPLTCDVVTLKKQAQDLLALVRPAIEHLEACRREAIANQDQLDGLIFCARRIEVLAQRWLDTAEVVRLYREAQAGPLDKADAPLAHAVALVERDRETNVLLGREFAKLYLAENKPFALDWTMKRYDAKTEWYNEFLRRLSDLREGAKTGQALPSPESLGMDPPKPKPVKKKAVKAKT
jgi:hypothetical protein